MPSSAQQVANVMGLLRGRTGKTADLGSGDGRLVRGEKGDPGEGGKVKGFPGAEIPRAAVLYPASSH